MYTRALSRDVYTFSVCISQCTLVMDVARQLCEARWEMTKEFQTQVLHYFSESDDESNYHQCPSLRPAS